MGFLEPALSEALRKAGQASAADAAWRKSRRCIENSLRRGRRVFGGLRTVRGDEVEGNHVPGKMGRMDKPVVGSGEKLALAPGVCPGMRKKSPRTRLKEVRK